MSEDGGDWVAGEALVVDETGLHARPAVKLTKLAKTFSSTIEIQGDDKTKWVNAKSPNAVMKLRAAYNKPLSIRASGGDAGDAVAAIQALIERNFDG
jgi:phosphocarrier protein